MKPKKPPAAAKKSPAARPAPLRRRGAARVIPESVPAEPGADETSLLEHPDGWYWVAPDGKQQFGPFETCSLARADRDRYGGGDGIETVSEAETLRESEQAIGISEWIDAETGAPAEGQSPPHLEEH